MSAAVSRPRRVERAAADPAVANDVAAFVAAHAGDTYSQEEVAFALRLTIKRALARRAEVKARRHLAKATRLADAATALALQAQAERDEAAHWTETALVGLREIGLIGDGPAPLCGCSDCIAEDETVDHPDDCLCRACTSRGPR